MIQPPKSGFPSTNLRSISEELAKPAAEPVSPVDTSNHFLDETPPVQAQRPPAGGRDLARARAAALNQGAALHRQLARSIKEPEERSILGDTNVPGKMVDLGGDPRKGLALTIHGINGAPEDVDALSQRSLDQGSQTRTFAYDDNYRRLTDTTKDLSGQLEGWLKENPGQPLTIQAHSMGSRVALGALDDLNRKGLLRDRKVEFNMVAPPLGGYASANGASMAPDFLAGAIKNLRPAKDMGTGSAFQKTLEDARLPDDVKVRVFTAGKDTVVDYDNPHFRTIVDNLHAQVIPLPDADHVNSVDAAARWLEGK